MIDRKIIDDLLKIGFKENSWSNREDAGSHLVKQYTGSHVIKQYSKDALASIHFIYDKIKKVETIDISLSRGIYNLQLKIHTFQTWNVVIKLIKRKKGLRL